MLSLINYYWRILATGLCFSSFGLGGLLLSLTVFPFIYLLPVSMQWKRNRAQAVIHYSFQLFVWMMRVIGILSLTLEGKERLQKGGNYLVVANHPTLIDVVLLISLLPRVDCIVKRALWRNPFLRGAVGAAGYISNSDPQGLIDECAHSLQAGRALLVFPEGTRTTPGKPIKFHRGAANIALRSKVNILPVKIRCHPVTLTKTQKWYQIPRYSRINMTMSIGDEVDVKEFDRKNTNISRASRSLTDYLQHYFEKETLAYE